MKDKNPTVRVLFLDDLESRVDTFKEHNPHCMVHHVTTVKDFIETYPLFEWDIIMLNHDLGTQETGSDAAMFLAKTFHHKSGCALPVIIHSTNPAGAANMASKLSIADQWEVYVIPFAWMTMRILEYSIHVGPIYGH